LENVRSLLFLQLENEEEIAHSNCLHSYVWVNYWDIHFLMFGLA
jgi:hypothetical protein